MILDIINIVVWAASLIITTTYSFMCLFRYDGYTWGPSGFKNSILFIISLIFVYYFKLPALFIIPLFIVSFLNVYYVAGFLSSKLYNSLDKTKKYTEEEVFKLAMNRKIPRTEGLFSCLIIQAIILCSVYFVYFRNETTIFSGDILQESNEIKILECAEKHSRGKANEQISVMIYAYCTNYYEQEGNEKREAKCFLDKVKGIKNDFSMVQTLRLCKKKFNPN